MSSAERIGAVHKKSMFVAFFIDCLLACLIENASFSLNLSCVKVFSTTCAGKQAMSKGALDPYDSHCEWNGNDYDKSKEEWLLTDLCHPILRRLVLKTMLLFKNHVSRRRGTLCDMVKAGAKKVLVSAPGAGMDATIVYGVNHHLLRDSDLIVSNASCTTNCLAPLVKQIHESFGIENGLMTTIHAYTNDQNISDAVHSDPYRARAAAQSMIPTKTGAASAIGLVLPELKGRLDGLAVRVPTLNVSLVDLTLHLTTATNANDINKVMKKAAEHDSLGVLACTEKPLVSIDFNHNSFSSNFDSNHTRVNGNLVKVLSWYDNEWGFSNRMLDTALVMVTTSRSKQVGVAA